eukprot:scaffold94762_cov62-Phaeocystis_antarctica.AAC.4
MANRELQQRRRGKAGGPYRCSVVGLMLSHVTCPASSPALSCSSAPSSLLQWKWYAVVSIHALSVLRGSSTSDQAKANTGSATAVDQIAVLEELGSQLVEARLRTLLHVTTRLLGELALKRDRDRLALVNHPTWDSPVARVIALDGDHLKLRAQVAGHDRIGGVVGAPLAQQAAPPQTGAAVRVEGHARSVEADRRRQRSSKLLAAWPASVGGALAHLGQQALEAGLDS